MNNDNNPRAWERWTKEEEEKVIDIVNGSHYSIWNGVHKASKKIGRSKFAIKERFTLTRLKCERFAKRLEKGEIIEALGDITYEWKTSFDCFSHSMARSLERVGLENIFSDNILNKLFKRKLKGYDQLKYGDYDSNLLVDK